MSRKRKWIIIAVAAAALVLAASISGVVLAAGENGNQTAVQNAQNDALWNRIAELHKQETGNALDV